MGRIVQGLIGATLLGIVAQLAACAPPPAPPQAPTTAKLPPKRSVATPPRWLADQDRTQWTSESPYELGEDKWWCANRSEHSWEVLQDEQSRTLKIGAYEPPRAHPAQLPFTLPEGSVLEQHRVLELRELGEGWILSTIDAQGAATLWWASRDGTEAYMLDFLRLVGFVTLSGEVLAVVGSSYGFHQYGQIVNFTKDSQGRWQTQTVVDLGRVPRVVRAIGDRAMFIVTPEELLRYEPGEDIEVLHRGRWIALAPNSMALHEDGTIHIGIRHGIVRLIPRTTVGYEETWLIPSSCAQEAGGCDCPEL